MSYIFTNESYINHLIQKQTKSNFEKNFGMRKVINILVTLFDNRIRYYISNSQMNYLNNLLKQGSNQRNFDWTPRF